MAKFNIDPRLSHLIVNTIELERDYIYEILVISGMVSFGGNIFYRYGNIEAADIQKLKFCHPSGDFITMLEAYKRWIIVPSNEQRVWSKKNFVSSKALLSVRKFVSRSIKQIEKTYRSYNFANLKSLNFNHTNCYDTILKLIYNSFKRSVGIFAGHYKTGYLSPVTCEKMVLHGSSSINKLSCELPQYICFDKVMTTTKTFIFHASAVKPEWIEDKDSLYTQFVKSSMVEHYTDFPKLGSKFLRYKIIRNIKSETPRLQESIKNNSLVKQVTSFYDIYVHIERGQIDACCHPENKSILITLLNEIIENNVQMAKSEHMEIPVFGTKIFINLGLFGIVSEITIPGNFLSITLPLYNYSPDEVKEWVEMITALNSMPQFQLNVRNPYEPELVFTAIDDAKKAFQLISQISLDFKPKWVRNKSKSSSLSFYIFLNMNSSGRFRTELIKCVEDLLGDTLKQNMGLSVIDNTKKKGKDEVLIETYSLYFANQVMEKISTQKMKYHSNVSLKSSWTVPNKVIHLLKKEITKLFKSDCKFDPRERNTRVEVFKKQLSFPLKQDDLWNEEECSSLLQGVPFSRAEVPVLFHCYSHQEDLGKVEKNCQVAIVEDFISQDYSLRIFGYPSATEKAIEEIERCLDNLQIINTDISFDKCKGRAGVLLQFLKIYGTNLFKLKNKKGITSVDIKLSEKVIRICGEKQVIPKIEAEIQKVIDNCPDIENIDEDDVCSICYLVPERNDMYRFDLCGHLVCHHECLKLLMSTSEFPLVCPREECDVGITVQDMCVAFNIGNKVKRAFALNCFNHFMANNTQNYSHCPSINCMGVYKITKESTNIATCEECFKDICTRCKVEYHKDITCDMFQRGEKNDIKELIKKGVVKLCPNCKAPIEKNGGCLLVSCRCGACLCWFCMIDFLSASAVYSHKCHVPR
ncbi:uncharacterized protein [Lepeophtheirus salmonis]|uniref:uncharacterized protein n=1 Tax=Lepeophtheirus salmonis TaxID=72036 RepID=UPI001AE2FE0F|nr:ATP-dependent RNA helicase DEAH11, chloroplastic-like [Lepeophtheirus salmonis]